MIVGRLVKYIKLGCKISKLLAEQSGSGQSFEGCHDKRVKTHLSRNMANKFSIGISFSNAAFFLASVI